MKSHPDEFIKLHLNRRIKEADAIIHSFPDTLKSIPDSLIETLDQLNKQSECKIIILNGNSELLYPKLQFVNSKGANALNILKDAYKIENTSSVDNLIAQSLKNGKINETTYLFLKPVTTNQFKVGVTFQANKGLNALKEEILDSLARVKYSNHCLLYTSRCV